MNWKVGNKVFETEQEAISWSKDLMSMGIVSGWSETREPISCVYLKAIGCAEPIEDFFGLIKEVK